MFGALAKERRKHQLNKQHAKFIRETVLDLVETEENEESSVSTDETLNVIDNDKVEIPEEYIDSVEMKVDEVLADEDLDNIDENKLEELADNIINYTDDAPIVSSHTN